MPQRLHEPQPGEAALALTDHTKDMHAMTSGFTNKLYLHGTWDSELPVTKQVKELRNSNKTH